jgi:AsmA family protein
MHVRVSTLIKMFVAVIVAALITGYAILQSQDFNEFKPLVAEQVERATGRQLLIDGPLDLNVSFTPTLSIRGVRFANAAWGSQPFMLDVERLEARVALWPLLSGQIDIEQVILSGADILIETDGRGRPNHQFEASDRNAEIDESSESDLVIPLIRDLSIKNARLTYRDGVSGNEHLLTLDELALTGSGPDQPLNVQLAATLNEFPLSVRATLGAPSEMLNSAKPWPIDAAVVIAGNTFNLAGTIAEPILGRGLKMLVEGKGDGLADLSRLTGFELPSSVPFFLTAQISGDAEGPLAASEIDLRLGDARHFEAEVTGRVGSVYELRDVDLSVKFHGSDLSPLAAYVPAALMTIPRFSASVAATGDFHQLKFTNLEARVGDSYIAGNLEIETGQARPKIEGLLVSQHIDFADLQVSANTVNTNPSDRVFSDAPLPLNVLNTIDAELTLQIDELAINELRITHLKTELTLHDGDFVARQIAFDFSGGSIAGAARVDAGGGTPAIELNFKARDVDLGRAVHDLGFGDLLEANVGFDVDATGRGSTVRQIMARLNGSTNLVVGEGRAKTTVLDVLVGGPTSVIGKIFNGNNGGLSALNCVVSHFEVVDGLATSKVFLADTEHVRITGAGTVNLANEMINVSINPKPKSFALNTAVPISVGGTLKRPTYTLKRAAVARKLGGLVGSLIFPPALIAGLAEFGVSSDNPCLAEATTAAGTEPSDGVAKKKKPSGLLEAVEGLGAGVTKGLKGLLNQ